MRKDIFIVGARLLGIWQLIGAVNSLAIIAAAWAGYTHISPGQQELTTVRFAVEFVMGFALVLKPEQLFELFTPARPIEAEESAEHRE